MTKKEIIDLMAWNREVERNIERITNRPMCYDYEDLAQMIYLALMEQPEERIVNLWEDGEMIYFLSGIIRNQVYSKTSPFFLQLRKFGSITDDIQDVFDIDGTVRYERGNGDCE